jgi:hypothetical protein
MRIPMTDRRASLRRKEYGMTLLVPLDSDMPPIAGVLIDVSEDGFRARHPYDGLHPNLIVSFIHRSREGIARVIWNRSTGPDFETGFECLDDFNL